MTENAWRDWTKCEGFFKKVLHWSENIEWNVKEVWKNLDTNATSMSSFHLWVNEHFLVLVTFLRCFAVVGEYLSKSIKEMSTVLSRFRRCETTKKNFSCERKWRRSKSESFWISLSCLVQGFDEILEKSGVNRSAVFCKVFWFC